MDLDNAMDHSKEMDLDNAMDHSKEMDLSVFDPNFGIDYDAYLQGDEQQPAPPSQDQDDALNQGKGKGKGKGKAHEPSQPAYPDPASDTNVAKSPISQPTPTRGRDDDASCNAPYYHNNTNYQALQRLDPQQGQTKHYLNKYSQAEAHGQGQASQMQFANAQHVQVGPQYNHQAKDAQYVHTLYNTGPTSIFQTPPSPYHPYQTPPATRSPYPQQATSHDTNYGGHQQYGGPRMQGIGSEFVPPQSYGNLGQFGRPQAQDVKSAFPPQQNQSTPSRFGGASGNSSYYGDVADLGQQQNALDNNSVKPQHRRTAAAGRLRLGALPTVNSLVIQAGGTTGGTPSGLSQTVTAAPVYNFLPPLVPAPVPTPAAAPAAAPALPLAPAPAAAQQQWNSNPATMITTTGVVRAQGWAVDLHDSVPVSVELPDITAGAFEGVVYYPRHCWLRPELYLRLIASGWTSRLIAEIALHSRGRLTKAAVGRVNAAIRQALRVNGNAFFELTNFTRARYPQYLQSAYYQGLGQHLYSVGHMLTRDALQAGTQDTGSIANLSGLYNNVVNHPTGQDRGILTRVLEYDRLTGAGLTTKGVQDRADRNGYKPPTESGTGNWDSNSTRRAKAIIAAEKAAGRYPDN